MTASRLLDAALVGCTVVIAADRRAGDLASALMRHGAQTYRAPALSIVPNADDEQLLHRTRELIASPPDIVVVTTGVGFRGWMDAAHENDVEQDLHQALSGAQFIARGPKARGAIQQAGFVADWVAESETAAEVSAYLLDTRLEGKRIAIQHHGAGADNLDSILPREGADVVSLTVYRWGPPPNIEIVNKSVAQAAGGEVDAVLFTSAPGTEEWLRAAQRCGSMDDLRARARSGRLLLAAVGPITAEPLQRRDLTITIAERGRLGSLVRCVTGYFGPHGAAPMLPTEYGALSVRSGGIVTGDEFISLARRSEPARSTVRCPRTGADTRGTSASATAGGPEQPRR